MLPAKILASLGICLWTDLLSPNFHDSLSQKLSVQLDCWSQTPRAIEVYFTNSVIKYPLPIYIGNLIDVLPSVQDVRLKWSSYGHRWSYESVDHVCTCFYSRFSFIRSFPGPDVLLWILKGVVKCKKWINITLWTYCFLFRKSNPSFIYFRWSSLGFLRPVCVF